MLPKKKSRISYSLRKSRSKHSIEDFYTNPDVIKKIIKGLVLPLICNHKIETFIDSSAGDGYLGQCLQKEGVRVINYDKSPSKQVFSKIIKANFLHVKVPKEIDPSKTMMGFNPPFGLNGSLAKEFLQRCMFVWKPAIIVFIIPYITACSHYPGYNIVFQKQLPKDSFIKPDGTKFDYPTFVCVYQRSIVSENSVIKSEKRQLPSFIESISQYKNSGFDNENLYILVRRIGNNCGKHGYVFDGYTWKEYRFAEIIQEKGMKRLPKLTEGAFFLVILKKNVTFSRIKTIIKKFANHREKCNYKRTISTNDLLDALENS